MSRVSKSKRQGGGAENVALEVILDGTLQRRRVQRPAQRIVRTVRFCKMSRVHTRGVANIPTIRTSLGDFRKLVSLIKIEHTLFALPLAMTGAVLAARGLPSIRVLVLVALAFTAARATAMAFNRLVDRRFDALNPRTAQREIPSGRVSSAQASVLVVVAAAVFILAAWSLNDLCFALAGPALVIVLAYSYTKRFTAWCHAFLGLCLGIAPLAGWLAVTGQWSGTPAILSCGVVFWVSGFDIIYACQDVDFDRRSGLCSLPARLGPARALRLAAAAHAIAFGLFIVAGTVASLGGLFYVLLSLTGCLLLWEHRLVRPDDLTRLDLAFFKVNSMVSLSLLIAVSAGLL